VKLDEASWPGGEDPLPVALAAQVQLRDGGQEGRPIEVQDLAHLRRGDLRLHLPRSNPEVRKQWAVFDAFIKLLDPEGFADLWARCGRS